MSKFTATIPVDVDRVINSLPKGHFFHGVRLGEDGKSLVIHWEHDDWKTPFTVPVEVSPAVLAGKERVPEVVRRSSPAVAALEKPIRLCAASARRESENRRRGENNIATKEQRAEKN